MFQTRPTVTGWFGVFFLHQDSSATEYREIVYLLKTYCCALSINYDPFEFKCMSRIKIKTKTDYHCKSSETAQQNIV